MAWALSKSAKINITSQRNAILASNEMNKQKGYRIKLLEKTVKRSFDDLQKMDRNMKTKRIWFKQTSERKAIFKLQQQKDRIAQLCYKHH